MNYQTIQKARSMLSRGWSLNEIAASLNVSKDQLIKVLK